MSVRGYFCISSIPNAIARLHSQQGQEIKYVKNKWCITKSPYPSQSRLILRYMHQNKTIFFILFVANTNLVSDSYLQSGINQQNIKQTYIFYKLYFVIFIFGRQFPTTIYNKCKFCWCDRVCDISGCNFYKVLLWI